MKLLLFLSDTLIPLLIFYIVATGLLQKQKIYEQFIQGAKDGFSTVIKIMPTLIGLMVAVGILRASGLLDACGALLRKLAGERFLPAPLLPVIIVRLFSNSAATGLVLDIFKEYGVDSVAGAIASVLMSSTETVFYTMSIYFLTARVHKTRWTLPGALVATAAGVAASVWMGRGMAVM